MISFKELNAFQKFCDNRIGFNDFVELSGIIDDSYADDKWTLFRQNPVQYITSMGALELLENINIEIERINYNG